MSEPNQKSSNFKSILSKFEASSIPKSSNEKKITPANRTKNSRDASTSKTEVPQSSPQSSAAVTKPSGLSNPVVIPVTEVVSNESGHYVEIPEHLNQSNESKLNKDVDNQLDDDAGHYTDLPDQTTPTGHQPGATVVIHQNITEHLADQGQYSELPDLTEPVQNHKQQTTFTPTTNTEDMADEAHYSDLPDQSEAIVPKQHATVTMEAKTPEDLADEGHYSELPDILPPSNVKTVPKQHATVTIEAKTPEDLADEGHYSELPDILPPSNVKTAVTSEDNTPPKIADMDSMPIKSVSNTPNQTALPSDVGAYSDDLYDLDAEESPKESTTHSHPSSSTIQAPDNYIYSDASIHSPQKSLQETPHRLAEYGYADDDDTFDTNKTTEQTPSDADIDPYGDYGDDLPEGDAYAVEDEPVAEFTASCYGTTPSDEAAPQPSNSIKQYGDYASAYGDADVSDSSPPLEIRVEDLLKNDDEVNRSLLSFSRRGLSRSAQSNVANGSASLTTAKDFQDKLDSRASWNERFQAIYDAPDSEYKYDALHRISMDFLGVAETYGKVIISELSLPDEEKSIKPIKIGGVAGGSKYACRGLLFKFAVDIPPLCLYGSDEYAQKAAGHELKGLNQWSLNSEGLHFPLMAIVRYCGFTLVALSMLPIGKGSLVYGSDDAGRTVHFDDDEMYEKMKQTAIALNLKGHPLAANPRKDIYGPGDIEGHKGTDNLHYVLDYARVYPPSALVHGEIKEKSRCLYRLLRPELVARFDKPLSSDAFTAWGRIGSEVHNEEVREATQYLVDEVIPEFARQLVQKTWTTKADITREMHLAGINVRYLGLVRRVVCSLGTSDNAWRHALLSEMIARTVKSLIANKWRELIKKYQRITPDRCIQEAIGILNAVIEPQTTPGSILFWQEKLRGLLAIKFPLALLDSELEVNDAGVPSVNLQSYILDFGNDSWEHFFTRISALTGIIFARDIFLGHWPSYGILTTTDILEIKSSIKQTSFVDFSFVMSKALNALRQPSVGVASRLFSFAMARLMGAPEISTLVLRRMISLRHYIVRTLKRLDFKDRLIDQIGQFIDVALAGSQQNSSNLPTETVVEAAVFLHEIHMPSATVITYLEKAIERDPTNYAPYVEITKIVASTSRLYSYFEPNVSTWISKTLEVAPNNPMVNFEIAMIYLSIPAAWRSENVPDIQKIVLGHLRLVKDLQPTLFESLDLHNFLYTLSDNNATLVERASNLLALLMVASELDCAELDATLKSNLSPVIQTFVFITSTQTHLSSKVLDYICSLGPFPALKSIRIGRDNQPVQCLDDIELAFGRLLGQCPILERLEFWSNCKFTGPVLDSLAIANLRIIDLTDSSIGTDHLKSLLTRIAELPEPQPITLTVPACIEAADLTSLINDFSTLKITHFRCAHWSQELMDALLTHQKDNLKFLSIAYCSEVMESSLFADFLWSLPNLILLDAHRSWLKDELVAPLVTRTPCHPSLECIISESDVNYLFTGATAKTLHLVTNVVKPNPYTIGFHAKDWEFPSMLTLTGDREDGSKLGNNVIPIVTLQRETMGHTLMKLVKFGRRESNFLRSHSTITGPQSISNWSVGSTRILEARVSSVGGMASTIYITTPSGQKSLLMRVFAGHFTRLQVPVMDNPDITVSVPSHSSQVPFSVPAGVSINYWALGVLTVLRLLP